MKTLTTIMLVALLLTSVLITAACGAKPPAVSKSQYDAAYQETSDAEGNVTRLRAENNQLQAELDALKAKRDALQKIADDKKK